jgi:hypothetical protein
MMLNRDGWILTAAHVFSDAILYQQHQSEIVDYHQKVCEIEANDKWSKQQKASKIKSLAVNQNWIVDISYWWGMDGVKFEAFTVDGLRDLAVTQLQPTEAYKLSNYPTFKKPNPEYMQGTSICRMGFPFHNIEATYNDTTRSFQLAPNTLPMPRFPNDGIITRFRINMNTTENRQVKFVETSTPGLRGQSGGPIFDVNGHIVGIQSHTESIALGFNPKVKEGNREIVVPQFINVGIGTHTEEVLVFLRDHNIDVNIHE